PLLAGLNQVTPTLERWKTSAKAIDQKWNVVSYQHDTAARLGMNWSIRSGQNSLIKSFSSRMISIQPDQFERVAQELERYVEYLTRLGEQGPKRPQST
ncbi:MAG: hypothetical protein ABEJ65_04630, partial [bacterium]